MVVARAGGGGEGHGERFVKEYKKTEKIYWTIYPEMSFKDGILGTP